MSPEVLEKLDFAQGALGENLLAKDIGNLLNGDALVRLVIHSGTMNIKVNQNRLAKQFPSCAVRGSGRCGVRLLDHKLCAHDAMRGRGCEEAVL